MIVPREKRWKKGPNGEDIRVPETEENKTERWYEPYLTELDHMVLRPPRGIDDPELPEDFQHFPIDELWLHPYQIDKITKRRDALDQEVERLRPLAQKEQSKGDKGDITTITLFKIAERNLKRDNIILGSAENFGRVISPSMPTDKALPGHIVTVKTFPSFGTSPASGRHAHGIQPGQTIKYKILGNHSDADDIEFETDPADGAIPISATTAANMGLWKARIGDQAIALHPNYLGEYHYDFSTRGGPDFNSIVVGIEPYQSGSRVLRNKPAAAATPTEPSEPSDEAIQQ